MTNSSIIGRKREIDILKDIYKSNRPEFVAIYGRRRIGKTFLVDSLFSQEYAFYMTGIYEGTRKEQLQNFVHQVEKYSGKKCPTPSDWIEAMFALQNFLEEKLSEKQIIIFIDELPWLDTPRSRFMKAFELFWNEWASKHSNIKLIVCGSATTWMTNKLLGDKGGLHNRVTQSIYLRPFNLLETEEFLTSRGFALSRKQVTELYMSVGGTPFYLNMLRREESVAQNIDRLFFGSNAPLKTEYVFLFKSLFRESSLYRKVVECLSHKMKGMTRKEILSEVKCEDTGFFSEVLSDLCNCDFIRSYNAFGKTDRNTMYQLTDLYTLFYLRFVKSYNGGDPSYWSHRQMNISSWEGYAFEQICLHHVQQIKMKLGISGILCNVCSYSWQTFTDKDGKQHQGGQIDLILDRSDNTINLCEMKYANSSFSISNDYAKRMIDRREAFRALTRTSKSLYLTMITSDGVEKNAGWQNIQSEVMLDDLFVNEL
jgi:AAA+ ATPase superfamily predicted ATPase